MNKLTRDIERGLYYNATDILATTGEFTYSDLGFLASEYAVKVRDAGEFLETKGFIKVGSTARLLERYSGYKFKQLGKAKYWAMQE